RYALNYKKLPFKTVFIEYCDVETELKKLGIPPSGVRPDKSGPFYTSPSIIDHITNTPVTDSYKIAEYLDKAYPSTPPLIPKGSEAFQAAFYDQFLPLIRPLFPFLLPKIPTVLNPRSVEYYASTRQAWFGKPLSEMEPKGEARVEAWKKVEAAFDTFHGWLSKSSGPFFMGETISFADFVVAAMLKGFGVCAGFESEEFKQILALNNGRWKKFLDDLEPYASAKN
ncbi:hypothetical protein AN958_01509, partial [Leucoagaricus sp. SymC.cos]